MHCIAIYGSFDCSKLLHTCRIRSPYALMLYRKKHLMFKSNIKLSIHFMANTACFDCGGKPKQFQRMVLCRVIRMSCNFRMKQTVLLEFHPANTVWSSYESAGVTSWSNTKWKKGKMHHGSVCLTIVSCIPVASEKAQRRLTVCPGYDNTSGSTFTRWPDDPKWNRESEKRMWISVSLWGGKGAQNSHWYKASWWYMRTVWKRLVRQRTALVNPSK